MLVLPKPSGISSEEWDKAEVNAMNEVIGLYGKTWHFWQIDKGDELPLGELFWNMDNRVLYSSADFTRSPHFDGFDYKLSTSRPRQLAGKEGMKNMVSTMNTRQWQGSMLSLQEFTSVRISVVPSILRLLAYMYPG